MWVAIGVDLTVYCIIGFLFVHFTRKWLPGPWNDRALVIPLFLVVGALITMATYTHWLVYPR